LEGVSAKERVEGLSADELFDVRSPQEREALAQRLKIGGSPSNPK
jgi:hypothetical protein